MPKRTPNSESYYRPTQFSDDENERRIYTVSTVDDSFTERVEADSSVHAMKMVLKQRKIKLPKIAKERGADGASCTVKSDLSVTGITTVRSWQSGINRAPKKEG